MANLKIPLVGNYNRRQFSNSGADQKFAGCIFNLVQNKITNSVTAYLEKRAGLVTTVTPAAGQLGNYVYASPGDSGLYSAFGATNSALYYGTASIGSITGLVLHVTECSLSNIIYLLITSSDGTGWYYPNDAINTLAYTADGNNSATITDLKVAGVPSVSGLYVGQKLTAASNIVAGSRILSINAGAFSAVLDTPTTGGAFNDLAITKEPVAKFNDADFPSGITGPFAELDGYLFIMKTDGNIYNSDLNSVSAWTAGALIKANIKTDAGAAVFKHRNHIGAFGSASLEFFYNAGNATGSPLSSSPQLASGVGLLSVTNVRKPLAVFEDSVFFVSSYGDLYTLEGFTPKKLSFPSVLPTFTSGKMYFLYANGLDAFRLNGNLIINVPVNGTAKSRWFLPEQNCWCDPTFTDVAVISSINSQVVVVLNGNDTSGKVFTLDGTSFQDNGAAFTMSVQIATDMGTNFVKHVRELRIEADNQTSGNIAVSYSDDDGTTFSTPRNVSLTAQRKRLTRLGSFVGRRLWKFEDSGNNANRIQSIEFDFEVGTR